MTEHMAKHIKVFFWDFYGPNAKGTAEHFAHHVEEFLAREALVGCETGTISERANHHAAWCKTPPELESVIQSSLRPKRIALVEVAGEEPLEV